jgi:hypothetical protein
MESFPGGSMRQPTFTIRRVPVIVLAMLFSAGLVTTVANAQSQEPKPVLPATPVAESDLPVLDSAASGVSGSSWQGPNSGVRLSWDPAIWSVEGELIEDSYDGLQIGTPISTVYLEAYDGFGGDAAACLADAERELGEQEGIAEVIRLSGRPLPVADDVRGEATLFGITATLPDGTTVRGVAYVECRTIVPGESVLEITWQAATQAFNEDFAHVETLLAAIEMPDQARPAATPIVPVATPIS